MKRNTGHLDRALRKNLRFERALHGWPRWLDSIANGRKVLRFRQSHPSFEDMVSIAKKALKEMDFPSHTLLEVYWLCCVFADYETADGFKFDKIVLPDWFPSSFEDTCGCTILFKGERMYPPEIWDEADRKFWFERNPVSFYLPYLPSEKRTEAYENYPYCQDGHFILVLPADHPVRKFVRIGRPVTTKANGETLIPHKVTPGVTTTDESKKVKTTKCSWCGGSMLWDAEDKIYKCIACGR
jgi:hypothetical protein